MYLYEYIHVLVTVHVSVLAVVLIYQKYFHEMLLLILALLYYLCLVPCLPAISHKHSIVIFCQTRAFDCLFLCMRSGYMLIAGTDSFQPTSYLEMFPLSLLMTIPCSFDHPPLQPWVKALPWIKHSHSRIYAAPMLVVSVASYQLSVSAREHRRDTRTAEKRGSESKQDRVGEQERDWGRGREREVA